MGFRAQGCGFRVQGSGFRIEGLGFKVQFVFLQLLFPTRTRRGLGCRVQGFGFRVWVPGFGLKVLELRFRDLGLGLSIMGFQGSLFWVGVLGVKV